MSEKQLVVFAGDGTLWTGEHLTPGARAVIEEMADTHRLALLAEGDPGVEQNRIADSGLADLFEIVRIVDRKARSSFRGVLTEAGVEAGDAWSVGNSLPSDINPALELGMGAVWVDAHVWEHERREWMPADGYLIACAALTDVPAAIGQRSPRWWSPPGFARRGRHLAAGAE